MLLTIDIGNTNITMGVFEEDTDSPYAEYWSTEESTQSRSIR